MHNIYKTNRTFSQGYVENIKHRIEEIIQPADFTPSQEIDPQKFYLEFKNRILNIVHGEIEDLKNELAKTDNSHLILLKFSALVDASLNAAFKSAVWLANRLNGTEIALQDIPIFIAACGGYGREEMYFRSDVDILIISRTTSDETINQFVPKVLQNFEYIFIHQGIFKTKTHVIQNEEGTDFEFDFSNPAWLCSIIDCRLVSGNFLSFSEFKSAVKTAVLLNQAPILDYCKSHAGYYDVHNTVFSQEPDVKVELTRLYWALFLEKTLNNLEKTNQFELLQELYDKGKLGETAYKNMQNGLNFLAKTRLFLHSLQQSALRDVLSFEVREQVAKSMGLELFAFYKKYFYNAAYPLKKHSRNLFSEAIKFDPKKIKTLNEHLGVNAEGQIIFTRNGETKLENNPNLVFQILSYVARDNYNISYPVIRAIEQNVDQFSPLFFRGKIKKQAQEGFKNVIRGKHFAKALRLFHEFGLLQNFFIPEFKALCGLLQDIYVHKFPTDIHILAALDQLNGLEATHEADPFLSDLYHSVKDKQTLRLSVLLHDIGKGVKEPGQNEEIVGSRLIPGILNNLGYWNVKTVENVAFLVERHLTMRDLMFLDPEDDDTYEMVWDLVGHDKERLKMLILLTYSDRGGTKMKMSASQIDQLKNFYQFTLHHKKKRAVSNAVKLDFIKLIRLPRDLQTQLEIYNEFLNSKDSFAVEMLFSPGESSDLVVCTQNRTGILLDIAAVLYFNQISITEASIHTKGGKAFDVFKIRTASGDPIEFSNYFFLQKQIKEELQKVVLEQKSLNSLYKGRVVTPIDQSKSVSYKKTKVKIIGRAVKVESKDIVGAFMMESKVFAEWNLEIQRAVLHAHNGTASNIIYVREEDVEKILMKEELFKSSINEALIKLERPQSILEEEFIETH
jgi:[protein-PII] uridylyltransferase